MEVDDVPMLVRREIEARIIAPFVEQLSKHLPRAQVLDALRATIERVAREQGGALPAVVGGNDLASFEKVTDRWQQNGALSLDVLQQTPEQYDFNVTRCRYAEMYQRLGIPELGRILSCSRDFVASEGFNPALHLTRTQTILDGAPFCDFRYRLEER